MIADDPKEIAAILIEENGADHALDIALAEITRANETGDFYSLSIWREIRGYLRAHAEPAKTFIAPDPTDRI